MSVSIDRIIKSATKSAKFGNFQAARMTCYEGLENYPNNPRLKELAKRLSKPQISSQQVGGGKADPLPIEIISKLKDLSDKNEANLLLKKCSELIEKYNKSALLWHFVGCAHLTKGHSIQAESALRKVIELDPTNFAAHTNLGNALKDLERFKEAEEMHKIALKLNPLIASPQMNLGTVYEELARYGIRCLKGCFRSRMQFGKVQSWRSQLEVKILLRAGD